jgi:aspartate kinase
VPKEHALRARTLTDTIAADIGAAGVDIDDDIGKVSVVGAGMKTEPGVAATIFDVLASAGINIQMISTSPIRVSCVVEAGLVEKAVRALHNAFDPPMRSEGSR